MEWDVVFEPGGPVVIRARGPFTVEDHRRLSADFLAREEWTPDLPVLFDNLDVDFTAVRTSDLQAAADTVRGGVPRMGKPRTAILTRAGADFGVMRQFNLMLHESVDLDVAFFTDEESARAWLRGGAAPRPDVSPGTV